jgi:hypothetical protein
MMGITHGRLVMAIVGIGFFSFGLRLATGTIGP